MKKEDQEKYEARLTQLRAESEGWEDKGTYWEKWDSETRTVLRKKKAVHEPQRWKGKNDYNDLPD